MNGKFIISFLCIIHVQFMWAQVVPYSSCDITDDHVFISFHENCLNSADEVCPALEDFKKYNLPRLIESGQYKTWQMDGWKMEKTGESTYRLYKKLTLFDQVFNFDDKFRVDLRYWLTPVSERLLKDDKNLLNKPAVVDKKGNVEFILKGYPVANQVILSASFNNWNEQELKMEKHGDIWKLTMKIPDGIYEYKFIVDGNWITDPANPFNVINQHHTYNSILIVGKDVIFQLKGYPNAKRVALSGSFNNWDKKGAPLTKTKDGWKITQKLPPGKHYYKFIIDGNEWIVDPGHNVREKDKDGYLNSVITVY